MLKIRDLYFAHYKPKPELNFNDRLKIYQFWKDFSENLNELSKDDWKLHKQFIKEGVNPLEIAKAIQNDDVEKLQKLSSQNNFDFNQTISPSLYERSSFINKENITLIDYAAFFCSVKCFRFLLLNGSKLKFSY